MINRISLLLSSLFIVALIFSSCKKDDGDEFNYVDARIIEEASGTSGCQWFVNVNGTEYVPDLLTSEFRTHFLEVEIDFTEGSESNCGGKLIVPNEITVNSIRVR